MGRKTKGDEVWPSALYTLDSYLQNNPQEAVRIARAALAGLYLSNDYSEVLDEEDSCPRGSGSDYVEEVMAAVCYTGVPDLIEKLRNADK